MKAARSQAKISVAIDSVQVADRHRQDLGNLSDLVASIEEVGLLNPIAITPTRRLIAGQRRLEACRLLGWREIPCTFVSHLNDARLLLVAERDENTCRKDMAPSEKVALGRALEELEIPSAEERKRAHGGTAPGKPAKNTSGKLPQVNRVPQVRDVVGAAVGLSGSSYHRARVVAATAERTDLSTEDQETARAALADMDRTGKITPAFNRIAGLAGERPSKPARRNGKPHKASVRTYRGRPILVGLRETIDTMIGLVSSLDQVSETPPNEEAVRWELELARIVSAINRYRRHLKGAFGT